MRGLLTQTSDLRIGGASSLTLSAMTDRKDGSSSNVQTTNTCAVYRSGISRNIFGKSGRMAEQRELSSRVLLQILPLARSIMRQKRRKPQPETTVHKDIVRDEFMRLIAPGVGRHLRDALEQARQLKLKRPSDE